MVRRGALLRSLLLFAWKGYQRFKANYITDQPQLEEKECRPQGSAVKRVSHEI